MTFFGNPYVFYIPEYSNTYFPIGVGNPRIFQHEYSNSPSAVSYSVLILLILDFIEHYSFLFLGFHYFFFYIGSPRLVFLTFFWHFHWFCFVCAKEETRLSYRKIHFVFFFVFLFGLEKNILSKILWQLIFYIVLLYCLTTHQMQQATSA